LKFSENLSHIAAVRAVFRKSDRFSGCRALPGRANRFDDGFHIAANTRAVIVKSCRTRAM
jgi:hypothetical protein